MKRPRRWRVRDHAAIREHRRATAWLVICLLAIALTLGETWRAAHDRPHRSEELPGDLAFRASDSSFATALDLLAGTHIVPGNSVELLLNGDGTYARLWRDLRSARQTIAIQMYYAKPGALSDSLAAILCERARSGVRALLLLDAFGAQAMNGGWRGGMRACGVDVELLRTLRWHTLHSAADRSHVRAVVVDGEVGYTGGFGLADYWLGDGHHVDQWRESNVRFEGPAVAALQAAFSAAWLEATGELIAGAPFLTTDVVDATEDGEGARAGVLFAVPSTGSTAAERFLELAIASARSRLYITNSYFVPSASLRRRLEIAADHGVDVRVLTAGSHTDVKTPWLAGRAYYDELTRHGIRVYEYTPTMMHAKTLSIDGTWATVGSMNFDSHSLGSNDEANLVVIDRRFAAAMDSMFLDDLRYSVEMTPKVLAARPWWELALEHCAVLLARIL
jgi:cardiolipin synthase